VSDKRFDFMIHMDSRQQPKFYAVPEDIENSNISSNESLSSVSNNKNETTNANNQTNPPPSIN
jgi:hypothetical protein